MFDTAQFIFGLIVLAAAFQTGLSWVSLFAGIWGLGLMCTALTRIIASIAPDSPTPPPEPRQRP